MKWTRDQIDEAHRIVNDIAERVDNRESAAALRRALAIYADLLEECREKRSSVASEETLEVLKTLMAGVPAVARPDHDSDCQCGRCREDRADNPAAHHVAQSRTPRTDRWEHEQECNYDVPWEENCRALETELSAALARVQELEERNTRDVVGLIQRLQEKTDREGFVNLAILHPELRALVEAEYREWLARAAEARRRSVE